MKHTTVYETKNGKTVRKDTTSGKQKSVKSGSAFSSETTDASGEKKE